TREELADLRLAAIGLEPKRPQPAAAVKSRFASVGDPSDHLANQLSVLRQMFDQKKNDDFHANFDYSSQRALFTMKNRRPSEFGDLRIYTPVEMLKGLFAKSNVPTSIDWEEVE